MSTTGIEEEESSSSSDKIDVDRFLALGEKLLQILADDGGTNSDDDAPSSDEFETLSKEFKELYDKSNDCTSEAIVSLAKSAVLSIQKERRERNSDDEKPLLALEETYGFRFLMIPPLNDDHLMSLLLLVMKKVIPEYVDGDIEDMSVNVLCCEIAIYINSGRVFSPDTVNRLASIMKECDMEDYRFMKVALALVTSFLLAGRFGEWNVVVDPNGQAESILIPICFKIMGNAEGTVVNDLQLMGSAEGTVVNDLRLEAYRVINVALITTSNDEEDISNHLIDALNSPEEEQVAGVCLFIPMLVKHFCQSDDDANVQRGENILRSIQHGMVSALREYPSNKIVVESALKNLQSHDYEDEGGSIEFLTAFANESDGLTVILNSLRQTATPKAYEEGMRILHFVLEAGMDEEYETFDDQRRPFLDRDGISIILDAIRIVPHSKAMDVLMLCSTIQPQRYVNHKVVRPIIDTNSIGSIVTATILYMRRSFSSGNQVVTYGLLTFLDFIITKKVRGADGGSLLHYVAAASTAASSAATEDSEGTAFKVSLIYFARKHDPSLDLLRDERNRLPLHVAIQSKQSEEIIRELVDGNKAVCTELYNGLLPFQLAAQEDCDVSVIYLLLKENPSGLKDATDTLTATFTGNREEEKACATKNLKKRKKRGELNTREEDNVIFEKKRPKGYYE